jgi:hypothetical protein
MTIRHTDKTRDTERVGVDQGEVTFDGGEQVATGTRRTLATLVQARLDVSQPSDLHELEAERLAADFVSTTHGRSGHVSQPAPTALARSTGQGLDTTGSGLTTTDETAHAINAASGGGHGLPDGTLNSFEQFFGTDLSGVRIHAGGQADTLCRSIEAQAFTKGNDVFFASGQYAPGTAGGDHLLAHELTHVVQQGAPAISRIWSLDPRKWGKTKEEIEQEKKDAFVAKMKQREASGISTNSPLLANPNNAEQNESDGLDGEIGHLPETGLAVHSAYGSSDTANNIAQGNVTNEGVDMTVEADGANIAEAAVVGTLELVLAVRDLMRNWQDSNDNEKAEKSVAVLQAALSSSLNAVHIASASGTAAAAAVPGLGLAVTLIDLVKRIVRIYHLQQAANRISGANTDLASDSDLAISLDTVGALAKRQRNLELAQVAGDVVITVGQIAMLSGAGSPWGAIVAVSGSFAKMATSFVGQALRWAEASKVQDARAAVAEATGKVNNASTDDERREAQAELDQAKKKQLSLDGWEAAREILEKASTLDENGNPVANMVKLVEPFGINAQWVARFNKSGRPPQMFDAAAESIVAMLGTSRDPLTFLQTMKSVKAAIGSFWTKLVSFFGGGEDLDVLTPLPRIAKKTTSDLEPVVRSAVGRQARKGRADAFSIADAVEDAIASPFNRLKGLFSPQTSVGTEYETRAQTNLDQIVAVATQIVQSQPMPEGHSLDAVNESGEVESSTGRERSNAVTSRPA